MMTVPGIGTLTALSYASMVENPANFARSRSVGAYIGLTARSYQSGEIDYDGHILKARRQTRPRVALRSGDSGADPRSQAKCGSRSWGLKLMKRAGFKRAAVAGQRKLSVILHAMWRDGSAFDPASIAA